MKYVALLRGVNVGGRIIKMAELKACFEKMGFDDVKTWLQSGNVTFESGEPDSVKFKQKIEAELSQTFNYPAKVWVLPTDELKAIVKANPFAGAPADYHQYVIFFENGLEKDFTAEVVNSKDEKVKVGQGVVYWQVQKGLTLQSTYGKLLTKAKYKNFNTNRNIRTLQKLVL